LASTVATRRFSRWWANAWLLFALVAVGSFMSCPTDPPKAQHDLCAVFDQHPEWYDYAHQSERTWGTSKAIQMAFVRHESSYREDAKPPMKWFLFIPLGRPSSATGYAQAQDPVWGEYQDERGGWLSGRGDMEDALDFIGWYNDKSHKHLGISKQNARAMYLAYHEGRGGYRKGSYKNKSRLLKIADKVERTARQYGAQLKQCGRTRTGRTNSVGARPRRSMNALPASNRGGTLRSNRRVANAPNTQ